MAQRTPETPSVAGHVVGPPQWVRRTDYERYPAGGGYDVRCSCGWRSPVETAPHLANLAGARHVLRAAGGLWHEPVRRRRAS
jgi:hypothetical protein